MSNKGAGPSKESLRGLDFLNLFLADVQTGVGPYLSAYLTSSQHWRPDTIGIALSASAIATVIAQTPAGALVDRLNQKRTLIILGAVFVTIGCLGIALVPTFPVVMGCQILIGVAAAIFPPAIASVTLGLVGRSKLDRQTGRIQAFNHVGNVLAAVLSALVSFIAQKGIFLVIAAMAVGSAISARMIRYREIDQAVARGDGEEHSDGEESESKQDKPAGVLKLLSDRRILMFCIAVVIFHFANAAMLPLVSQLLAKGRPPESATLYLSACIIVAQLVMAPTSAWVGRLAESGRKPIFLFGFIVLPIRGVLYTLWHNPYYLVSVQILDGLASGIFSVLSVLVIADFTKGTGRFNLTQGLLATAVGLGGFFSTLMSGFLVEKAGYNFTFLVLAAIAAVAVAVLWFFVPESKTDDKKQVKDQATAPA
ncbi:MAG: MFS transporter [Nostocaceae cyanobacterium]|nr:MFS transporter [Nostocaceae cyanobacterium]